MTWKQKRQQSYSYLEKFRGELSEEAYKRIRQTIGTQAIENMFSTLESVRNMVRIEKGEATADEIISDYKKEWGAAS